MTDWHTCLSPNQLLPDPNEPDCLTIISGLAHMSGSGEVSRLCGDKLEYFAEAHYWETLDFGPGQNPSGVRADGSDVLYNGSWYDRETHLDSLYVVGARGVYEFVQGAFDRVFATTIDPPRLENIAGLEMSFVVPGHLLLRRARYTPDRDYDGSQLLLVPLE